MKYHSMSIVSLTSMSMMASDNSPVWMSIIQKSPIQCQCQYYRGIYSAKHLQILQNIQFQIQIQCFHNFKKCPDICTESGFYKVHDECFLWQHWIQIPKQKQNLSRQPGQSCPLCRPVFAKSEMQISSKFSLSHRNFS